MSDDGLLLIAILATIVGTTLINALIIILAYYFCIRKKKFTTNENINGKADINRKKIEHKPSYKALTDDSHYVSQSDKTKSRGQINEAFNDEVSIIIENDDSSKVNDNINGNNNRYKSTENLALLELRSNGPLPSSKFGSHQSLDDTCICFETMKSEVIKVSLHSNDITGLGFHIKGNMRDGIFINELHSRGPACETGKIRPGDRIMKLTIDFENIVYEDAFTILSYASPYPVEIELLKHPGSETKSSELLTEIFASVESMKYHPLLKSQSMSNLSRSAYHCNNDISTQLNKTGKFFRSEDKLKQNNEHSTTNASPGSSDDSGCTTQLSEKVSNCDEDETITNILKEVVSIDEEIDGLAASITNEVLNMAANDAGKSNLEKQESNSSSHDTMKTFNHEGSRKKGNDISEPTVKMKHGIEKESEQVTFFAENLTSSIISDIPNVIYNNSAEKEIRNSHIL